ncbi:MAG: hypothetical protein DMG80_19590 [Acidobacteria bacterium]|nr:MAG: hypothetical protein DMG80_19590 [Acidobacteriota bacterium]
MDELASARRWEPEGFLWKSRLLPAVGNRKVFVDGFCGRFLWKVFVEEPAFRPALRGNIEGFSPRRGVGHPGTESGNFMSRKVNTESKHDRLSLESILVPKVCQLVPPDVPMIMESRVDEAEINEEIRSAIAALNAAAQTVGRGIAFNSGKLFVEEPAFRPALR